MPGMMANFTMANSAGLYPKMSGNGARKKRRKTARIVKRAKRRTAVKAKGSRRRVGKPRRLVKGSAAAKAYMAKIRRKRRP